MLGKPRSLLCLCKRQGFRGGPFFEMFGSQQLPASSHLRERDEMLPRAIVSGGGVELISLVTSSAVVVTSRVGTVTSCGNVPFHPLVHLRHQPEFIPLAAPDCSRWPRCLPWHGWLPGLPARPGEFFTRLWLVVTLRLTI